MPSLPLDPAESTLANPRSEAAKAYVIAHYPSARARVWDWRIRDQWPEVMIFAGTKFLGSSDFSRGRNDELDTILAWYAAEEKIRHDA